MNRFPTSSGLAGIALAAAALFGVSSALAQNATKDDAVAMVKKGITFIKASGKDKGYAEITAESPQFIKHDLYLVVYGLDGKCLAHGANEKQSAAT